MLRHSWHILAALALAACAVGASPHCGGNCQASPVAVDPPANPPADLAEILKTALLQENKEDMTKQVGEFHRKAVAAKASAANDWHPVQFPSCFADSYEPKQTELCLRNLFLAASYSSEEINDDVVTIPLKELAHSVVEGSIVESSKVDPNTYLSTIFADRQAGRVFREIGLDETWTLEALRKVIKLRMWRMRHNPVVVEPLQHAVSAYLCKLVSESLKSWTSKQRTEESDEKAFRNAVAAIYGYISKFTSKMFQIYDGAVIDATTTTTYDPRNGLKLNGEIHPTLRDMLLGLRNLMFGTKSSAEKSTLSAAVVDQYFSWNGKIRVNDSVENYVELLSPAPESEDVAAAMIKSVLDGQHPPASIIAEQDDHDLFRHPPSPVTQWLQWQVRYNALKSIAVIRGEKMASKVVAELDKQKLVPKYVNVYRLFE